MNITKSGANVVVNTDSIIYAQGKIAITFTVAMELEMAFNQTNLGWFAYKPYEDEILIRARVINPDLDLSQVTVTKIDTNTAVISVIPNSRVYGPGMVIVSFITPIELKTVLVNTSIGGILIPSAESILDQLAEDNPGLDTTQLTVTNIRSIILKGTATINVIPGSKVYYQASIPISFAIISFATK